MPHIEDNSHRTQRVTHAHAAEQGVEARVKKDLENHNFADAGNALRSIAYHPHEFQAVLNNINKDRLHRHHDPLSVKYDHHHKPKEIDFSKHDIYDMHHGHLSHHGLEKHQKDMPTPPHRPKELGVTQSNPSESMASNPHPPELASRQLSPSQEGALAAKNQGARERAAEAVKLHPLAPDALAPETSPPNGPALPHLPPSQQGGLDVRNQAARERAAEAAKH